MFHLRGNEKHEKTFKFVKVKLKTINKISLTFGSMNLEKNTDNFQLLLKQRKVKEMEQRTGNADIWNVALDRTSSHDIDFPYLDSLHHL